MGSQASDQAVDDATAVMVALRRIVRMLRLAEQDAHRVGELSAAQLFVLHSLSAAPASSLSELATRTLTDQSSVSTVVAKLVSRKLVSRTPSAEDRRRVELAVTPAGEKIVRNAPRVPQALIVDAVAAMPAKQRRALVEALEVLVTRIGGNAVEPHMFLEDDRR